MRKLLSIALLAVFVLPLALLLLAQAAPAEQSLPACCRRMGLHHCAMHPAAPSGQPTLQAHCPFQSQMPTLAHASTALLVVSAGLLVSLLLSHPTGIPQTESRRRMARDRSRQKRGPPALAFA